MTPRRTVVLGMTIAGMIFVAAYGLEYAADERGGKRFANPLPKLGGIEVFVAWFVMFGFLFIMSEIPASGELAEAFTWLILLAVLFTYGVAAFNNLLGLMAAANATGKSGTEMEKRN